MSLIKCAECGKEISDKADKCPNCGCPLNEKDLGVESFKEKTETKKEKKKESKLSIWACVLAIFTCTIPIAFILALVDLCGNDKEKKHTGSWFAIAMSILIAIALSFSISNSEKKDQKVDAGVSVEEKTGTGESIGQFEYGDCTVKYLRHEIIENDMGETVLVVYYDFTNNGDDSRCFDYLATGKAFQNGVELESSFWHANEESKNSGKEIQKGTNLTVADSYVLGESRDNVTIEFRPFNVWSDKLLMSLELTLE